MLQEEAWTFGLGYVGAALIFAIAPCIGLIISCRGDPYQHEDALDNPLRISTVIRRKSKIERHQNQLDMQKALNSSMSVDDSKLKKRRCRHLL